MPKSRHPGRAKDDKETPTIEKSIEVLEAKFDRLEASDSSKTEASAGSKPAAEAPKERSGETSEFGSPTAYA